jgi:hypothetical protein
MEVLEVAEVLLVIRFLDFQARLEDQEHLDKEMVVVMVYIKEQTWVVAEAVVHLL